LARRFVLPPVMTFKRAYHNSTVCANLSICAVM